MAINIEMPKLSETMTEGILLRWNKCVGDFVDVGEIIAEVETDKATISIECYDDGFLIEQCAAEGTKVPVGDVIAKLDSQMPKDASTAGGSSPGPVTASMDLPRRAISPLARKMAAACGVNLAPLVGKGSGPKGRIMAEDVRQAKARPAAATPAPGKPGSSSTKKALIAARDIVPVEKESTVVPLSQRQKFVAEATVSAKSKAPHFYMTIEADVTQLENLRRQVNIQAERTHGNHFTFNDFIIRALVSACKLAPSMNASFDEVKQAIVHFSHIGINVAVDVDGSVLFPVLQHTERKSMMQMSQEVRDLTERAKDNRLRPSDFEGGTITLTNLGAHGVEHFYAIINTPQAAIVSVGSILEKPVVRKEVIGVGKCVSISLSCDHRVVNARDAARFLEELKNLLETPTLLLV